VRRREWFRALFFLVLRGIPGMILRRPRRNVRAPWYTLTAKPRRRDGTASGCRRCSSPWRWDVHRVPLRDLRDQRDQRRLLDDAPMSDHSGTIAFHHRPLRDGIVRASKSRRRSRRRAARARRLRRRTPCVATAIAPGEQWHLLFFGRVFAVPFFGQSAQTCRLRGQMVPGNPRRTGAFNR